MVGNEPGGQWMRNSAVDNPQFLAGTIASFLGWRGAYAGKSYAEARPLAASSGERLSRAAAAPATASGRATSWGRISSA
jgi:protein SCO1/2